MNKRRSLVWERSKCGLYLLPHFSSSGGTVVRLRFYHNINCRFGSPRNACLEAARWLALLCKQLRQGAVRSWDGWDQQEFGLGMWLWERGSMAWSFPSLRHRIVTHRVKEEFVGSKRATKGQREKKSSLAPTSPSVLPQQFEKPVFFYLLPQA